MACSHCSPRSRFLSYFCTWLPRGHPHVCTVIDSGQPLIVQRLCCNSLSQWSFPSLPVDGVWRGECIQVCPDSDFQLGPFTSTLCACADPLSASGALASLSRGAAWRAGKGCLGCLMPWTALLISWLVCGPGAGPNQDCDLRLAGSALPNVFASEISTLTIPLGVGLLFASLAPNSKSVSLL